MELKFKHFIILNVLDIILTLYALSIMNLMEANPVMSYMIKSYGLVIALISVKIIGVVLIYLYIKVLPLKLKKVSLYIFCGFYLIVVGNNTFQIVRYIYV